MCTGKAWKKLLVLEGKQCNHCRSNNSKIPYISVLGKNNLKQVLDRFIAIEARIRQLSNSFGCIDRKWKQEKTNKN